MAHLAIPLEEKNPDWYVNYPLDFLLLNVL